MHWPFDVELIAPLVPRPLEVETFDGAAWVTLTPFSTTCEVLGTVPVPGPRRFPETNVRTYVRGPDGGDGLWFFSLDVTNRANVALGRSIGLAYHLSEMEVEGGVMYRYAGQRQATNRSARYEVVLEGSGEHARSERDVFLTGRWSGYVVVGGRIVYRCDVEHEPWSLHHAVLKRCDPGTVTAAGIPSPDVMPVVHYAAGVNASLSLPVPLSV